MSPEKRRRIASKVAAPRAKGHHARMDRRRSPGPQGWSVSRGGRGRLATAETTDTVAAQEIPLSSDNEQ
jgi:hypothetical protein